MPKKAEETKGQIRCFICFELDESLKDRIGILVEKLKTFAPNLSWVSREALHLTLKFCGNLSMSTVELLSQQLQDRLEHCQVTPFLLELSGVGGFPSLKRPRVLWLGVSGDVSSLLKVQLLAEEVCSTFREIRKDDKSFSPHLTLARVKRPSDVTASLLNFISSMEFSSLPWQVKTLTFMKSDLTPKGAIYTPLARYYLGGAV